MNGWFRVHRRLLNEPLWVGEPFTRGQAWVDLVGLANHEPGFIYVRGNRVDLKRGDVGWSEVGLAERWKWSRGRVRRFLRELETDQRIVQQKSFVSTVITITNYGAYQTNSTADRTADGTADSTADGQQTVHEQEGLRRNKKEQEGCGVPPQPAKQPQKTLAVKPEEVPEAIWCDFQAVRRAKRAPLTATALGGIAREADKAGITLTQALTICAERGWQSFRADWNWQPQIAQQGSGGRPAKTKLYPIPGKNCGHPGCSLPAVYKSSGSAYDHYFCPQHMPAKVKELYE